MDTKLTVGELLKSGFVGLFKKSNKKPPPPKPKSKSITRKIAEALEKHVIETEESPKSQCRRYYQ